MFHPFRLLLLLLAAWVVSPAASQEDRPFGEKLNSPLRLEYGETEIFPYDFILSGARIDEIRIAGEVIEMQAGRESFLFDCPESFPPLVVMRLIAGEEIQDVLLIKSEKQAYSLRYADPEKTAGEVKIKGEFNAWTPTETVYDPETSSWKIDLLLQPGDYQYVWIVDGKELCDPDNPLQVDNNLGGKNSLLKLDRNTEMLPPVLLTERYEGAEIILSAAHRPEEVILFWNNIQLEDFILEGDRIILPVPPQAREHFRSHIRAFAWNAAGVGNDLLIPLQQGKVVMNPQQLNRHDLQARIIYNVFVDRFVDGNPGNNKLLPTDSVLPKANYMGGDLAGIRQSLEGSYFDALHVNTLWISPVVKNTDGAYGLWPEPRTRFSAYHGYWPTSFTRMDSHFGQPEELKELVNTCHEREKNLLLDVVANHVHQEHPYYQNHPEKATALHLPDGSLNLERWDEHRLTTWFDTFLPSLDLEQEDVREMLSDSLLFWLKTYRLDGFRHDAAKHVPLPFWRLLTKKIREEIVIKEDRPVYQLGETYGSPGLIASYLSTGLLDAQFDFNVYDAALTSIAGGGPVSLLADRLKESLRYYGSHNTMGYITGNQDRGRFVSYAGGALKFDENAKKAGWTREIGVGDTLGYDRLKMLMAFNMTIPGLPVIYYGDEYGMPGGNDPDCRRMMRFEDQLDEREKETLEVSRHLSRIRKENMALMYGDFLFLKGENGVLQYARKYFENSVWVVLNNRPEPLLFRPETRLFESPLVLQPCFGSPALPGKDGPAWEIPPYGFEIFTF